MSRARIGSLLLLAITMLLLTACNYAYQAPAFDRPVAPQSFAVRPAMVHPADNQPSPERIALGRRLFFDPQLSGNGRMACATCHQPDQAFADGQARSPGAGGARLARNTPSVMNSGHMAMLFHDGRAATLEAQALQPIANPAEMALPLPAMTARLKADAGYRSAFAASYGRITPANVAKALAVFQRTLVSGTAPFDRHLAGDDAAISAQAKAGLALFAGKAQCAACHSGWLLSDGKAHDVGLPDTDRGRGAVKGGPAWDHHFRTPSLREIGRTAPYMHDGSLPTLAAVVDHYADGKIRRPGTPPAITLSPAERAALVAFLETLDSK